MPPRNRAESSQAFSQSQLSFSQSPSQNDSQDSQGSEASTNASLSQSLRASSPSETLSELDSEMFTENNEEIPSAPASTGLLRPSTALRVKRGRTSWVYKHMYQTDDMQAVFFNSDRREIWPCRYCGEAGVNKEYIIAGGTRKIEEHLKKKHNILAFSPARQRELDQQLSIKEAMASADSNPLKRRKLADAIIEERQLDGNVVELLFVKFIANDNQALRLVTCPEFRTFLAYLNPNINASLPTSTSTITGWVMRQFQQEKDRVKARMHSARTKIHISCDMWTSPNCLPILGVIGHYINEDNVLEHVVLGLREVMGAHNGENIATVVMQVLVDWGIISKLGWFQMDNAANNDTMLRHISRSEWFYEGFTFQNANLSYYSSSPG